MKKKFFLFSLLLLLLTSCNRTTEPIDVTVPIQISQSGEEIVDVEFMLVQVKEVLREYLPEGYYRGLVFRGSCADIPNAKGKVVFHFIQVNTPCFLCNKPQILSADAIVDTTLGTFDLKIRDVTNFYPNTEKKPEVSNETFEQVLHSVNLEIINLGFDKTCKVDIFQRKDAWGVMCDPIVDENGIRCDFDIDKETFKVKEN